MALRTQCPRCKQPLSVPNKLAGSYASCPRCQGRFWVAKDTPLDPAVSDSVGSLSASTLTQVPVATPPVPSPTLPSSSPAGMLPAFVATANTTTPPQALPRQYFPSVTPLAPAAPLPVPLPPVDGVPSAPPAAPPQARKVARFVSADAAQSTLKLAADGQLPNLQLQEGDKKEKGQGKSRAIPPLVMIGAWILSVVLTVAIVIINDDGSLNVTTEAKKDALAKIEEQFFGHPERSELLPYQQLLREARKARAHSDFKAEQQCYKQVLALLHTETWGGSATPASRNRLEKGITGSRNRDWELERLILTVLSDKRP